MPPTTLPPESKFVLPGDLGNPMAVRDRNRMLYAAYSRQLNPRLLEFMFYAPWDHLLHALVSDIPHIFVIPQHLIYRARDTENDGPITENISAVTQPQQNVDARTPDFGLFFAKEPTQPAAQNISQPWESLTIESAFICLLVEVKRPPSRSISDPNVFTNRLRKTIFSARTELYRGAAILFADEKYRNHQPNRIILIAVAGEWYSWTELSRRDLPIPKVLRKDWFMVIWPVTRQDSADNPNRGSSNNVDDEDEADGDNASDNDQCHIGDNQEDIEDSDTEDLSDDELPDKPCNTYYHHGLSNTSIELSPRNRELYEPICMKKGMIAKEALLVWSQFIRMGTEVSNQHLSAIHEKLNDLQPKKTRVRTQLKK